MESEDVELGLLEGSGEGAVSFATSFAGPLVSHRTCGGAEGLEFARARTKDGVETLERAIGEDAPGDD